jgi:hypothetical protein
MQDDRPERTTNPLDGREKCLAIGECRSCGAMFDVVEQLSSHREPNRVAKEDAGFLHPILPQNIQGHPSHVRLRDIWVDEQLRTEMPHLTLAIFHQG